MSLPDQTPRLPKWIFLTGDAALLALAWYIAKGQGHPLSGTPLVTVAICVGLAGILGVIPFLTDYAWSQDKALDERQRGLEALARTVTTSAEQISIAAAGLHEIADLAQKNLKLADALPQKLQDKIAEFKAQTASTRSEEIEELEREITALRASENDKLEAAADKIGKTAADFGKAEALLQKQFAQAAASMEKGTKAQTDALNAARDSAIAAIEAAVAKAVAAIATATPAAANKAEPAPYLSESAPIAITSSAEVAPVAPNTPSPFAEPEREPAPVTEIETVIKEMAVIAAEPVAAEPEPTPKAEPIAQPVAESVAEPVADEPPAVAIAKTPKKRAPKKVEEPAPTLSLDETGSSDFSQTAPDDAPAAADTSDTAISSDGATRLLVTAYIGIGNRLFLRGEGPGLSWEKGVPLQFVSIGKWRWETMEATQAVKFRLFKNDTEECAGLGEKSIEPGQQQQLSASF